MYYHLRYTPYELPSDTISKLTDKCNRFIVAREEHSKNGEPCEKHYHIWMDIDSSLASVRNYVLKYLQIPKVGMGKNNKYYALKEWDEKIEYIIKQGKIEASKGFSEAELTPRVPSVNSQPSQDSPLTPKKEEKNTEQGAPLGGKREEKLKEKTNFWTEIMFEAMHFEKLNKKKIEVEDALKIISRIYIKKLLPLPHPGDRKRWAYSLVLYSKINWGEAQEKIEEAIEDEMAIFMADHMITIKSNK